jgi:hypothetical protein
MSKILRATCENNTVVADETTVPAARIASLGVGPSEGVLILDDDRADYLTSNASDLDESLEQLISALTDAASGLSATSTALNTVGTAAGVPPLTLTPLLLPIDAAASSISAAVDALSAIKERLK